jgi:hypothetical protein
VSDVSNQDCALFVIGLEDTVKVNNSINIQWSPNTGTIHKPDMCVRFRNGWPSCF